MHLKRPLYFLATFNEEFFWWRSLALVTLCPKLIFPSILKHISLNRHISVNLESYWCNKWICFLQWSHMPSALNRFFIWNLLCSSLGVPLQFLWERDDVKKMETIITLKHFSPQAKQQTTLVLRFLDEYQAKKRNNNNQLSRIEEIEHLQMIYRASGAAMRYIRQVGALADGYLFPVLRAVHWTTSDKMEQLLPNWAWIPPDRSLCFSFKTLPSIACKYCQQEIAAFNDNINHSH